ncbi:MAG: hypothetical protein AB7H97_22015 [Pseudobdellovibrionaceae bacterium]
MSIDSVLLAIENFRSQIEQWGISNEALWIAGVVAAILLVISLREVLTWFLKIQTLTEDLRALRREVKDLKRFMEVAREVKEIVMNQKNDGVSPAVIEASPEETGKAPAKRFPFDH